MIRFLINLLNQSRVFTWFNVKNGWWKKSLEPLKEPLIFKIKEIFSDFIENNLAKEKNIDNKLHDKIDKSLTLG